jgi:hypothetical protein
LTKNADAQPALQFLPNTVRLLNPHAPTCQPASKPHPQAPRFPETPTGLPLTMGRASPHPTRPL